MVYKKIIYNYIEKNKNSITIEIPMHRILEKSRIFRAHNRHVSEVHVLMNPGIVNLLESKLGKDEEN